MPDYGSRIADKAIDQTARKIRGVYKDAWFDVKKKLNDFQKRHQAKGKEMFDKLVNGEITQAEYHAWMRGQVFIGRQWQDKLDQISRVMNDANREAMSVVRKGTFNVFAENYNFEAFKMEKKLGGAISFNIYDDKTVARLLKKNPKMLPEWKIHERKDYAWNRQKVENAITQGIIQGEGIDQITDRLTDSLITTNENRMRTFARTSMTGAQNAGRLKQMEDAEDQGIKVKKRWLATLDNRTRDTHAELDGQEVPVDQPFEVDGMEIMYPGDPNADPSLVYNCRCTMIEVYDGIDRKSVRRDADDNEVDDKTYKEWKKAKEEGTLDTDKKLVEKPRFSVKEFTSSSDQDKISGGITGAKKTQGWEDRHAKRYYEEVRNRKPYSDAKKIVMNENVPYNVDQVETIRNHVFMDEHDLETGHERFAPDKYQSDAWQRLVAGQGTAEDVVFLQHEYEEHRLMEQGYSQREAHDMADEKYNWWALVKKRLKVDE